MPHHLVVPVIDRPGEYLVGLEQFDNTTFVHLTVAKWNHRVAKQLLEDTGIAQNLLNRPVYAVPPRDAGPHYLKFLKWLGFHYAGICHSVDGYDAPMYERTLG